MKGKNEQEGIGQYHARFLRGIKGSDPILETPIPQIAFVGRSNVGKSSTLNALLGADLARISQTPGKTQEINFFSIADRLYFVDLPGYGYAKMPVKDAEKLRSHILLYLTSGEARPKLLVLIIDARHGATKHDRELLEIAIGEGHPLLVLLNKIDKLNQSERAKTLKDFQNEFAGIDFIPFSATRGDGVEETRKRIFE